MSMCELATLSQSSLPVKIVIMKNGFLGMVREYQHYSLKDRYSMVKLNDVPDISMIARAYGVDYFEASDMKDIDRKISEFLKDNNAAVMQVLIDPMDTVK